MRESLRDLLSGIKWSNRLLTTILMTFLLFVVLSTATFAWYTVSNVVTISDMEFSLGANDNGGGDLCVSWTPLSEEEYNYKLDIQPVEDGDVLYPMIPKSKGIVGETLFSAYAGENAFNKANQVESALGGYVTKLDSISSATPYLLRELGGDATEIYITNKLDVEVDVKMTYVISAETYTPNGTDVTVERPVATKFRSAVFTTDGTDGDFILRGLIAKDGEWESVIHYGELEGGKNINDVEEQSKTESITFKVPASSHVKCLIAVWFDGVDMVDEDGANKVNFDILFE